MFLTVLTYILLLLEAICSILLIGVILLQRSKGQGVGLAFGGGAGEALFGAHMGNVLTKTTVVLAIVFLVNTTVLALLGSSRRERSIADTIPVTAPAAPVAQPAGPMSMPAPMEMPADGGIPAPVEIPSESIPEPVPVPVE